MIIKQPLTHRGRQQRDIAKAGERWVGDEWDLVFCTQQGHPINNHHLVTYYKAILRHSCASLLVAQGLHPRIVMEQLGHSTITPTMNTYAHVIPDLRRQAANMMDGMFGSPA